MVTKKVVKSMVYGYARVSTNRQAARGNSLVEQEQALKEAGAEKIVTDKVSGTKMDRPQLTKLLRKLDDGDKLVVTKLDRFARTAAEGSQTIQELIERGVTVHVLNMGLMDSSPIGKLLVNVMLSFAEFERDMIVERTQNGKAIARARGKRVDGRPRKFSPEQEKHAMELLGEGRSYSEVSGMTGISISTLQRIRRRAENA